jgi:plastocyanin
LTRLSVEELRARYDREWDRTQRLEDKAKNIISTAGTFTSLIFGFVTLSTSIFKFAFPLHLAITIGIAVTTSILAILLAIVSLGLQTYKVTFNPNALVRTRLQQAEDAELVKGVIGSYVDCVIFNSDLNNKKAKKVYWGTYLLLISIVLIGIATGITLTLFQSKPPGPTLIIPDGASIQGHSPYEPNPIGAIKGDTLVIENKDSFIHTITSGKGPDDPTAGNLFDTGIIKPGDSAEVVIANLPPSEYPFFCTVHPYMKGTLRVIESRVVNDIHRFEGNQIIGTHENVSKPTP